MDQGARPNTALKREPDGRYVVIGASDWSNLRHRRPTQSKEDYDNATWTAISMPPYYTAIGLWLSSGPSYFGGGIYESNSVVALSDGTDTTLTPRSEIYQSSC